MKTYEVLVEFTANEKPFPMILSEVVSALKATDQMILVSARGVDHRNEELLKKERDEIAAYAHELEKKLKPSDETPEESS